MTFQLGVRVPINRLLDQIFLHNRMFHPTVFCLCRKRHRSYFLIGLGKKFFVMGGSRHEFKSHLISSYVKKLIEDTNGGDDVVKLLQYCSWENPHFSRNLLTELLWHCGFAYWHDMRHHTELLLSILLIEDSWQHHRIHNAIMGKSHCHARLESKRFSSVISIFRHLRGS